MKFRTLIALAALALGLSAHAADVTIDALPAASTLVGTEAMAGVQSTTTVKITPIQIGTFLRTTTSTWTATQTFTSPVFITPALGTPASGEATNLTGTASAMTVGTATVAISAQTATVAISAQTATVAVTANNLSSTLGVANGGTGATTLTENNVLLGNGTGAPQFVAPGTSGNVLTSNGTTWTSAAAASGGVTSIGVVGQNGITISGSPVTSAGTVTMTLGAITPTTISTGTGTFTARVSAAGTVFTPAVYTNYPIVSTNGVDILSIGPYGDYSSRVTANYGLILRAGDGSAMVLAGPGVGTSPIQGDANNLGVSRFGLWFGRHAGATQINPLINSPVYIKVDTHTSDEPVVTLALTGQASYPSATTYTGGGPVTITGGAGATGAASANGGDVTITGGAAYGTGVQGRVTLSGPLGTLYTNTAIVGAVTIDRPSGKAIVGLGTTSTVVTNSLVTANSQVICTVNSNDATATLKNCTPTAGSFTITVTAAATADTNVAFLVLN